MALHPWRPVGVRYNSQNRRRMGWQVLKDWGVPWASPVAQGYPGEDVLGGPYVPNDDTADVLETEDKKKLSTEGRWPYVS